MGNADSDVYAVHVFEDFTREREIFPDYHPVSELWFNIPLTFKVIWRLELG